MKKTLIIITTLTCILFSACRNAENTDKNNFTEEETTISVVEKGEKTMYQQITAEEAKNIMDSNDNFIILDVREQDEFDAGHIPGAILIPYTEIEKKAAEMLPDKAQLILVYCRSGRRSKIASESLVKLGYTNIKEFGGIIDWHYEITQ